MMRGFLLLLAFMLTLVSRGDSQQVFQIGPFVTGPTSATDGDCALFNGSTGKIVKDSGGCVPAAGSTFPNYLITLSTQSGTTYTLAATDCGTIVQFTNAGAVTVTLPNSLSVGCSIGALQIGAGQVTFSAAAGATLHSAHSFTKTFAQYAGVSLTVYSNAGGTSAIYDLVGDGA